MNILQLRGTLAALLSSTPDLVGSYILPNGSKIPAIYVTGQQGVPREWKVSGLEVVIQEFPRLNPRPGVGTFQQRKQWAITLVDYDTSSNKLGQAASRISRVWPDAQFSFAPETDTAYGQYRITIPDVEIQNLIRLA